ncbi:MAG: hypothetical protein ACYTFK_09055 [Planctomycetota bacterium]|jgi:uncharacterized membrane protein (DUF106 family)
MTAFLAQIIAWLNIPLNAVGRGLTGFVAAVPGWLSNTVISAVMGVILLVLWKYTSNQDAIGRVKDNIKASLLAMKLFKDSISVTLQAQGRVFKGAGALLFHAIRPMLVMIVPVCLILGQMSLWYQVRPLQPGEEAVVAIELNGDITSALPRVKIAEMTGADVTIDQTHALSERQIFWKIKAREEGYHKIVFEVDNQRFEKDLAIGGDFMRVSPQRPGLRLDDVLMYPSEKPFQPDSLVQSIRIDYPPRFSQIARRLSRISLIGWFVNLFIDWWWIAFFFVVSMVFAFIFKPFFNVKI